MSHTATAEAPSSIAHRGHLTFWGQLRSETIKLFSVSSTYWTIGVYIAISVGFAALFATSIGMMANMEDVPPGSEMPPMEGASAIAISSSVTFGQLILAVLAVLMVSGEYAHGTIQSTLLASPRRSGVLGAKVLLIALLAAVVSLVTSLITFFVTLPILSGADAASSLGDEDVVQAIIITAVYIVAVAVFSVFVAFILRGAALGISAMVVLLFVLPIIGGLVVFADWDLQIADFLFSNSLNTVTQWIGTDAEIELLPALPVTIGWFVAAGGGAWWLLKRRDA